MESSIDRRPALNPEAVVSLPNLITVLRVAIGLWIFSVAAHLDSPALNIIGLFVYWFLDMLDGFLARVLQQETILGAQIDILSDRLLLAFFYFNYLRNDLTPLIPVILFLLNFLVIDHYLSNQFIRWPIVSPNYFYKVDDLIWKLNWSPVGKFINTGPFTLLLLLTKSLLIPLLVIVLVIGLKIYSFYRLFRQCSPPNQINDVERLFTGHDRLRSSND